MKCFYAEGVNLNGNCLYPHEQEIGSLEDLLKVVSHDYTAAKYKANRRSNDNFIGADCLFMDCDNDHSENPNDWVTPEMLKENFKGVELAIHFSRNHNKVKGEKAARPRFHVLFKINYTEDREAYVELKKKVQAYFPFFDTNAMDAGRFFFGTNKPEGEFVSGTLALDDFLEEDDLDAQISKHQVVEGNRNNHMSKFAAKILKKYGDTEEAHNYFLEESEKLEPPLEDSELNTIWKSALKFYEKVKSSKDYVAPETYAADWKRTLTRKKDGSVVNSLKNLLTILKNDENLQKIVFNELADSMEITGEVPWHHVGRFWRDADDSQLICYIDENYGTFTKENYNNAVTKIVDDRSYHPIKNYFASLPVWDGTHRVETLLIDYLGAEDNAYTRAVTRKTLVAAYVRVLHPGIKFDNILVLNGPQGIGKSTLIAKLGMAWYSDSLSISDMNDKTAAEKLQGFWLMEIGELAGMKRADIDKVKAFISRQDDKYRASFGRRVTPHERQSVFFGTTNADEGFLRDVTGNRRFWTVKTPGSNSHKPWELTQDLIDQIWAEVMIIAQTGEKLYLDDSALLEFAEKEQNEAMEHDEREGIVVAYLETLLPENWDELDLSERLAFLSDTNHEFHKAGSVRRLTVTNAEIWSECFGHKKEDLKSTDSYTIRALMKRLPDWVRTDERQVIPIYGRQRVYRRKK